MTGRESEGGTAIAVTVAAVRYVVRYVVLHGKAGTNNPSQPPVVAHPSRRAGVRRRVSPHFPFSTTTDRSGNGFASFVILGCRKSTSGMTGYGSVDVHKRSNVRRTHERGPAGSDPGQAS
ncbi:hypothetical protein GCM10010251_78330 [Streptomyces aurantiogriseus]|uniref:Uncharacterized protein n=1 Tax=Streptomyces aurantiogriseus TaxID=66870 RepID=A0A918FL80_9ACTN|nr:hypothetical protein GCM10010251_78330 [Streptomyces aurantiogriseus]